MEVQAICKLIAFAEQASVHPALPRALSVIRYGQSISRALEQFIQKPTTPCSRRLHAVCAPFTCHVNEVTDELCGLLPRVTASLGSVLIELHHRLPLQTVTDRFHRCWRL